MCPVSFLVLLSAGLLSMTSARLLDGVANGEQLLKSGQVFVTSEQEVYFEKSATGYSEKFGRFWSRLSVCSGDRTGKNFDGVTKNFKYFLCPRRPWDISSNDEHCCGKNGNQTCCTFAESKGVYSDSDSGGLKVIMKSGMPNGAELLKSGKVFVAPQQEFYFDKTATGYSEKFGNFWSFLSVCSGNKTGKDFSGHFKDFDYFLCPKIPGKQFAFLEEDFCCGDDGSQSCCSIFDYIGLSSIFGLAIATEIIGIVMLLLCFFCCACCICCTMRGVRSPKPQSHAAAAPGNAPAFQHHQQQPHPAQMPQQQPYPAQMPQQQPYPAQMPQQQPYTAQMPQPQPYTG